MVCATRGDLIQGVIARCRAVFLVTSVSAVAVAWIAQPARAEEFVWGCLIYASNDAVSEPVPTRLKAYNQRIERDLGFSKLQTLSQGQTRIQGNNSGLLTFTGDFHLLLTKVTRDQGGIFLLNFQLFRGDQPIVESQTKVSLGSPIFIYGPLWRAGRIVVALLVSS